MRKSFRIFAVLLAIGIMLAGCTPGEEKVPGQQKFSSQFFGTFDTIVQVIGYAPDQAAFTGYLETIRARFNELSRLYDSFYEYSGINNICTINKNAGIAPVEVEPEILDMLEYALDLANETGGQVNIAMGPVLEVWRDYMNLYSGADPETTQLPSMEKLEELNKMSDSTQIVVDRAQATVYLEQRGMSLDVGAVAKGYAAQLVADEIYEQGFTSFIISAGGNVVVKDAPEDGVRSSWPIGIQDPFADPNDPDSESLDVVMVTGQSVVTSGDYQRFYFVGEERIHHIIDPETLMPANHYRALTVVAEHSGEADYASTCLFTLPYEQSRALAEERGWKVMWVFPDGEVVCTDDLLPLLRDRGGATSQK